MFDTLVYQIFTGIPVTISPGFIRKLFVALIQPCIAVSFPPLIPDPLLEIVFRIDLLDTAKSPDDIVGIDSGVSLYQQ